MLHNCLLWCLLQWPSRALDGTKLHPWESLWCQLSDPESRHQAAVLGGLVKLIMRALNVSETLPISHTCISCSSEGQAIPDEKYTGWTYPRQPVRAEVTGCSKRTRADVFYLKRPQFNNKTKKRKRQNKTPSRPGQVRQQAAKNTTCSQTAAFLAWYWAEHTG